MRKHVTIILVWLIALSLYASWQGAFDDAFFVVSEEVLTTTTNVFFYTGADQYFTNLTDNSLNIKVELWGAGGAGASVGTGGRGGGGGGYSRGYINLPANGVLTIIVGEGGRLDSSRTYGGGGRGMATNGECGGGGGRSAIRTNTTELLTAGGGGGSAFYIPAYAGLAVVKKEEMVVRQPTQITEAGVAPKQRVELVAVVKRGEKVVLHFKVEMAAVMAVAAAVDTMVAAAVDGLREIKAQVAGVLAIQAE